jgi:hypothetical protein
MEEYERYRRQKHVLGKKSIKFWRQPSCAAEVTNNYKK